MKESLENNYPIHFTQSNINKINEVVDCKYGIVAINDYDITTLFNGSNFIYQLQGEVDEATIVEFNSTKKFADKFELLKKENIRLNFVTPSSKIYNSNLQVVDGGFAKVIADMLVLYYSNAVCNTLQKNIEAITKNNPLGLDIDTNNTIYEMKLKDFLTKHALGMQASEKWMGDFKTSGGYLIVKTDGEILCYHFYYFKQFQDYLLSNTKFETPSTSRHNFGFIYKDGEHHYLNLNLQVRFIV